MGFKYTIVLLLLFSIGFVAIDLNAQTARGNHYVDDEGRPEKDTTKASYYRVFQVNGIKDHYLTGELAMVAECSQMFPRPVKHGKVTWYYKSGGIKESGSNEEDQKIGLFQGFYENGNPKHTILYEKDERRESYNNRKAIYKGAWKENGELELINNTGMITERSGKHINHKEIVNSVLINEYSIDTLSNDTIHLVMEKDPEYAAGIAALAKDISRNLRYPKDARRKGISGVVYLEFIVDKQGYVTNVEVAEGIDPECDEAAKAAVGKLKRWTPGYAHNKPVRVKFTLPLEFKLY